MSVVLKDLVVIPVHTKPEDSEKELDEIYDVFLEIKKKWKTDVSVCFYELMSNHTLYLFILLCFEHL